MLVPSHDVKSGRLNLFLKKRNTVAIVAAPNTLLKLSTRKYSCTCGKNIFRKCNQ
jgi:hypothetical protein